jgi:hypothetical protein
MSFVGSLDDVSVSDVLQFIHLGGRSGTLTLSVDDRRAEIGFHRGRIISARGPDHIPLGEWLLVQGALPHADIETALRLQRRMSHPAPLGKLLVEMGFLTLEQLTEQITHQIEETVYALVAWTGGSFEFELDTLRPIDDLAVSPGDILPPIRINTQTILLEAARILDERNRADHERKVRDSLPPGTAPAESEPPEAVLFGEADIEPWSEPSEQAIGPANAPVFRVQVVSPDAVLRGQVQRALGSGPATVVCVAARDAGTRLPGEVAPVVLVDLRTGDAGLELLSSIRRIRPGATLIGIAPSAELSGEAHARGALAFVPPDPHLIAACIRNVQRCRDDGADASRTHATRMKAIAKLSRVFGEFRSGLLNATVSINLMNLVSESVERAVLFVVAPTRLVVLGAYGDTGDGRPLSQHTRQLQLPLSAAGALADSVRDARSRSLAWEDGALPPSFAALIGRPASGSYTIFPLLGSRKVIATLYVDNGRKHTPIDDVEFLEVATSQIGLYYENELLRRQLLASAPGPANDRSRATHE